MTSGPQVPLTEQRRLIREKMRAQRELIADQIGPEPEADGGYPRSRTMRFLSSKPGLAVTVLAELASLLVGARYARTVTAAMALARIVRSATGNGAPPGNRSHADTTTR